MRFPFVHKGPVAWWEWLFLPLVLVLLLVALALSIPVCFAAGLLQIWKESRLRRRLFRAGRRLRWPELEQRLQAGEGTLIVEMVGLKGPIRHWWTPDDIVGQAPAPFPQTFSKGVPERPQSLRDYAAHCASRYTDIESGTAFLVPFRAPQHPDFSEQYPNAKVVTMHRFVKETTLSEGHMFYPPWLFEL